MHGYYIKNNDVFGMSMLMQSSWIIRKILGAREYLQTIQEGGKWIEKNEFSIKKLYIVFRGNQ